jgi:hypothetical protein
VLLDLKDSLVQLELHQLKQDLPDLLDGRVLKVLLVHLPTQVLLVKQDLPDGLVLKVFLELL